MTRNFFYFLLTCAGIYLAALLCSSCGTAQGDGGVTIQLMNAPDTSQCYVFYNSAGQPFAGNCK